MLLKSLIKNPVLSVGLLFFFIFMAVYGQTFMEKMGWIDKDRLNPTSCRAVMVKFKKRIPANWQAWCEDNNLAVQIQYPEEKDKKLPKEKLCPLVYREIANYLKTIASPTMTPNDNLERTDIVRLTLVHPQITIAAVTEGKYLAKLATITRPKLLAEHLKVTVQVKEKLNEKNPIRCQSPEKDQKK